jgi:hypothetical protein
MDPASTLGIIAGAVSIVKAFQEGRDLFQIWRKKRKTRKPGEEELENSLETGGPTVESEWKKLSREYGRAFDDGDGITIQVAYVCSCKLTWCDRNR